MQAHTHGGIYRRQHLVWPLRHLLPGEAQHKPPGDHEQVLPRSITLEGTPIRVMSTPVHLDSDTQALMGEVNLRHQAPCGVTYGEVRDPGPRVAAPEKGPHALLGLRPRAGECAIPESAQTRRSGAPTTAPFLHSISETHRVDDSPLKSGV